MIVFSVIVRKIDPKDERFPGFDAMKRSNGSIIGFTEVYLCEIQTDGEPMECPFFLTDALMARHTRQEAMAMMLHGFAKAIEDAGKVEAAA